MREGKGNEKIGNSYQNEEKVYTIGWNERIKLIMNKKRVIYEDKSNLDRQVRLECDIDQIDMNYYLKLGQKRKKYNRITSFVYDQTVDLNYEGDRWEGACLNGSPCGYGIQYNSENQMVYRGFVYEGKKMCYGEEYHIGNKSIEYQGSFINGLRHGWGFLFDRKGELIYEGAWYFGRNDKYDLKVNDGHKDGGMISNMVRELVIGNNCFNDLKELILRDYDELERLEIGKNCFKKVKMFSLQKCKKLTKLIVGDHAFENSNDEMNEFAHTLFSQNGAFLTG